jgi:arylsulfatase A-like enzyme
MKGINRREFLKAAGFSAAALTIQGCGDVFKGPRAQSPRPNLIFIMTDDHAAHALSCYGSKINKTPNLDRIAKEGMRFENCFCTNSICAPSRAVILTGKYSHINGKIDNSGQAFDGNQQTFPKLLQEEGYETAMIGKWHLRSEPTGFDYWNVLPGQGVYYNPDLIEMGQRKKYTGYVTDIITDLSLEWLKKRNKDKPFCLLYQHKAPHANWQPGPKHKDMYDDIDIPEPDTFDDDGSGRGNAARECEMSVGEFLDLQYEWGSFKMNPPEGLKGEELTKWKYQFYMKNYLRCVASVDDNVGRVLDYLDESGLAKNTLVVYTSDQGFYLGDHGWYDKRFMYEESLRMPLLMRLPGIIESGTINDDMVLNLDFAPTFLELAGVKVPDDIQGESFTSMLKGERPKDWRKSMYYHYYEYPSIHMVKRHYGVRTQRYKLMRFYYDIDEWELYDLENDPDELKNFYNEPGYAKIVKELKQELARLQKKYGDSDELAKTFLPKNKPNEG